MWCAGSFEFGCLIFSSLGELVPGTVKISKQAQTIWSARVVVPIFLFFSHFIIGFHVPHFKKKQKKNKNVTPHSRERDGV